MFDSKGQRENWEKVKPYLLGTWVTARMLDPALGLDEVTCAEANQIFEEIERGIIVSDNVGSEQSDGVVKFSSCKALVEYIRSLGHIECERDISTLRNIAEDNDCLTPPSLSIAEGFFATEPQFDEDRLMDIITSMQDGEFNEFGSTSEDGIILTVELAGITFVKHGYYSEWMESGTHIVRDLPDGYTEAELEEELEQTDYAEAGSVNGLISAALDEAVDLSSQYSVSYDDLRSWEEDVETIESELRDVGCDRFYYDSNIGEYYVWEDGDEANYDDFVPDDLMDVHTTAESMVASVRGYLLCSS